MKVHEEGSRSVLGRGQGGESTAGRYIGDQAEVRSRERSDQALFDQEERERIPFRGGEKRRREDRFDDALLQ